VFAEIPLPVLEAMGWLSGWLFSASMVIAVFRMLTAGRLRTGREVEEIRRDRDARIEEAMSWKKAWEIERTSNSTLLAQNSELMRLGQVSAHVLTSLPAAVSTAEKEASDGG